MAECEENALKITTRRHHRSRLGCERCRQVSRKCDEQKPVCSRCQRLSFNCDYRPRIVWRDARPGLFNVRTNLDAQPKPIEHSVPIFQTLATWAPVPNLSRVDLELLHDFLVYGHRHLHFSNSVDKLVVNGIFRRFDDPPILTAAVLSFQASQMGGIDSLVRFDKVVRLFRNTALLDDIVPNLTAASLVCSTAMFLGYSWTGFLGDILSPTNVSNLTDRATTDGDALILLEALAVLDLDFWVIGKQTKSKHIWTKYCRGRTGVDWFTGLPRPLLDIIAVAYQNECSVELRQWLTMPMPSIQDMDSAMYHACHAYTVAAILHLHIVANTRRPSDSSNLCNALRYHINHFQAAISTIPTLHARRIVWPTFILGQIAEDTQTRQFVRDILNDQSLQFGNKSYRRLGEVLEEMWSRTDAGEYVTPTTVARARKFELGIW